MGLLRSATRSDAVRWNLQAVARSGRNFDAGLRMIRTVADFLHQLVEAEVARLDAVDIVHGPTIGEMYEGLSADLLRRAVPEQLGLRVVDGFITDGLGNRSGQVDCMLVRGSGDPIPYTDAFVWPVKDVIAVFEIKKRLHHDDLVDASPNFVRSRTLIAPTRFRCRAESAQLTFVRLNEPSPRRRASWRSRTRSSARSRLHSSSSFTR